MLRSTMKKRLKDKVKLNKIQQQTGAKDIRWRVKKAKLNYVGHIVRDTEKWGKVVEEWSSWEWKKKAGKTTNKEEGRAGERSRDIME